MIRKIEKKVGIVLMTCLVSLFLFSCEQSNIDNKSNATSEYSLNSEEKVQNVEEKNTVLKTEYEIEDYQNGLLIVSKSDGLLYGVINRNNEEIVPVKYDEIKFLKSDIAKKNDKQFFEATYEGKTTLFDNQGKIVIKDYLKSSSGNGVSAVEYEIGDKESSPLRFAQEIFGKKLVFYNERGDVLSSFDLPPSDFDKPVVSYEWVSEKCFIMSYGGMNVTSSGYEITKAGTIIYDYEGNIIDQFDNTATHHYEKQDDEDGYYIYFQRYGEELQSCIDQNLTVAAKISVDENGVNKVVEEYDWNDWKSVLSSNSSSSYGYYLGENHLYSSNGTWKYEDASGNAVYDVRYYSCVELDNAYLLTNEDKQVCVITNNGKKVIDYGEIVNNGDNCVFKNTVLGKDNFFADDKSVCIVTKEGDGTSAFIFSGEK